MIGWIKQGLAADAPKVRAVPASLFIRDKSFGIDVLPFDLIVDESHRIEFDISDHAVENGSTISDFIGERLRTVEVNGFFTNHPIGQKTNYTENNGNVYSEKTEIKITNATFNKATMINTALERYEALCKLAKKRKKVRIITALEVYDEMYIESLSANRSASDGEAIRFTITLREIRTAKQNTENISGIWNPPQPPELESEEQKAISIEVKYGMVNGEIVDAKEIAKQQARALGGKTTRTEL